MPHAVIVSTARTPIGKAYRGAFNMTHGADLGGHVVKNAVERAGADPAEVEDVILGCALPEGATGQNIARQAAIRAGHSPVTEIAYKSMAYSRGASAIGVGVAMGEIATPVSDERVLADWSLASGVASASAGIELENNIVIVLGNARAAAGDTVITHAVMQDAIDGSAVLAALTGAGVAGTGGTADSARAA